MVRVGAGPVRIRRQCQRVCGARIVPTFGVLMFSRTIGRQRTARPLAGQRGKSTFWGLSGDTVSMISAGLCRNMLRQGTDAPSARSADDGARNDFGQSFSPSHRDSPDSACNARHGFSGGRSGFSAFISFICSVMQAVASGRPDAAALKSLFKRFHGGNRMISDRRTVGEHHHSLVDYEASGGRHAVLQRVHIILVHHESFPSPAFRTHLQSALLLVCGR